MTQSPFGAPAPAPAAASPFGAPQTGTVTGGVSGSTSPWITPSQAPEAQAGDQFDAKNLIGALLLITPKEHVTGLTTTFTKVNETTDMLRADVAVIGATRDGNGNWIACPVEQSLVLHDAGIFQGRLIAKLKGSIGQMVLGRLALGQATQGNPPYELTDPSEADKAAAMQWYQSQQQSPPF